MIQKYIKILILNKKIFKKIMKDGLHHNFLQPLKDRHVSIKLFILII